ncbi:MAG: hypothetical protein H6872_10875 [Methylobacteriaceae bacterium]|nr:hypothetical protein [Rhodoblastus sp.]MCC0005620.1 hypothetical protein [Methylobacteriaceae bacterium]
MTHRLPPLSVCAALLALASCNSSPAPQAVATNPAPQQRVVNPITPQGFKLPEGSGCSGAIARYRAVIANDHQTGNVGESVYKQIEGEIAGASAACAAGRDGEAMSLIAASKSRHGYPG